MIRMLTSLEGKGVSVAVGQTTDKLSKQEESRYIAAGLAVAVKPTKKKVSKKAK